MLASSIPPSANWDRACVFRPACRQCGGFVPPGGFENPRAPLIAARGCPGLFAVIERCSRLLRGARFIFFFGAGTFRLPEEFSQCAARSAALKYTLMRRLFGCSVSCPVFCLLRGRNLFACRFGRRSGWRGFVGAPLVRLLGVPSPVLACVLAVACVFDQSIAGVLPRTVALCSFGRSCGRRGSSLPPLC